jgi:hypothetical protein
MCKAGKDDLKEVVLTVQKLQSEGDGGNLESALAGVAGVHSVQLQVPENRVVVGFTGCRAMNG